ncbi:piggyBac transposable element-derived protein 3 [Nephila pilipes]|uniref:PiggyBac transposable element-derived protein 3 n=1 Tax=Nephila pilipes TaxID=299642 RepID=A0A8X6UDQ7_NEPPI|nr:piggyBac transposable element-derived protein 3 [Nephila pilipes]
MDRIQLSDKILPKEYVGKLACMTKLYPGQKEEMTASECIDITQFLGLLLLSGYYWVPKVDYYWSAAEDLKVDIVSTVMSRNHFHVIKKKFHLNDNPKLKSGDKPGKVAQIFEELGKILRQFVTFLKKFSIDESMVPYYGHHTCTMFTKHKPIRFGFKIWMLCSSSGYPYAMKNCSGRKNEPSGMPLGEDNTVYGDERGVELIRL